jgi:hypothetical protein
MGRGKDRLRAAAVPLGELSELLASTWDPDGSVRHGGPRDAHARFAPRVLDALEGGPTAPELAELLRRLAGEQLGIPTTADAHLPAALAILEWWGVAGRK